MFSFGSVILSKKEEILGRVDAVSSQFSFLLLFICWHSFELELVNESNLLVGIG